MALALLVSATAQLSCFARSPAKLPERPVHSGLPGRDSGTLEIRLHFGPEADLDLHVTDPEQETVYFGNNPSLAGGVLANDLRCDAPSPRVERVEFAAPKPGRYRVGVDYARRCRRVRGPVPYEIEVRGGELDLRLQGEILPGRFQNIALEFDLEG
jgi:hypothetical protein